MSKFKDLVSPYFHESMMYKLTENNFKDNSKPKDMLKQSEAEIDVDHLTPLSDSQLSSRPNGPRIAQVEVTNSDKYLNYYLTGYFEALGHISLSKAIKVNSKVKKVDSKVKNTSPYIAITFVNKDLPLINKLVVKFGGRLRFKTKENAIV